MIINHHFVLHCFDSLWHYGLPSSPPPPPPPPTAVQIFSFSTVTSIPSTNISTDRESAGSLPLLLTHAGTPAGSLPRLFNVLDEDGDGRLSLCDMCSLVAKLGMSSDANSLLSLIHSTLSIHQHQQIMSGTRQEYLLSLDFPQFAQLYASLFAAPQPDRLTENPAHQDADDDSIDIHDDELLDAFQVYDTNRDGFITAAELAAVLLDLGLLTAGDQHCNIDAHLGKCQAYIESVDLDGNGMVDLQEFKAMMNMHNCTTLTS